MSDNPTLHAHGVRPTRYSKYPQHVLRDVPQEMLDAARSVLAAATPWKDVDAEMAEPIADAVVAALRPWLLIDGEANG
jgi:hypothetical protein